MGNSPKEIIIHCSDLSFRTQWNQLASINNYHKSQGFPVSRLGYYVGYHKLVTGGKVYTCREDDEIGAHCNTVVNGKSMNEQSLGICVSFDGDIEYMPQDWYEMLQKEVFAWQDKYNIPNDKVKFHRAYNLQKSCPGVLLGNEWLWNFLDRKKVDKPIDQKVKQKEIQRQITALQRMVNRLRKVLKLRSS